MIANTSTLKWHIASSEVYFEDKQENRGILE